MNNGKICVSVGAATAAELIERIRRAEPLADIIEVRLDYLDKDQIAILRSQISILKFEKPLIATFRASEQGGRNALSLDERIALWSEPIAAFWAADVEEDVVDSAAGWRGRIVSYHDYGDSSPELASLFERLCRRDAFAVKVAVNANDAHDAIAVWSLLDDSPRRQKPLIPIGMGEAGKWTRILGLAHGAYLTYASLDEASETASGQFTVTDMLDVYRVKELDRDTKVYGVVGDPVSESLSPYIHNAAFAASGRNAVFIPLQVKDVDAFFKRMVLPATREVELNFAGFAVTMPHKQAVMTHLDEIDATATQIGAVNTIVIENHNLRGHNTDAIGFLTPLKASIPNLEGRRVAILGAGGAARACAVALANENAVATVFTRDASKAAQFPNELGVVAKSSSDLRSQISDFDILVNATPIGMKGQLEDASPLTADELKGVKLVFDLVTRANDTPLIREAKRAGIMAIGGLEMLLGQAARQFEIWTGREAPAGVMRAAAINRMETMR